MSSYIKDTQVERIVLLKNLGTPVTGVLPAQVLIEFKKFGENSFEVLPSDGTTFVEIADGYYSVIFRAVDTDVVGTFAYKLTGAPFDNIIFDQINIVDPLATSGQQTYYQDASSERTVLLSLAGTPVSGILPANVICKIKKTDQTAFTTKVLTALNWVNLGSGYYSIRFSAEDMSRTGSFVYTLTGVGFDNFAYDEFVILPSPNTVEKDICVVTGQIVDIRSVNSTVPIKVSMRPVEFPAKYKNKMVAAATIYTYLDSEGKFSLSILRGVICIVEIPRVGIKHQITIPDVATADLISLLPPFAIDYSI